MSVRVTIDQRSEIDMDPLPEVSFNYWIEIGIAICAVFGAFLYKFITKFEFKDKKFLTDVWSVHGNIHECLTELRVITDAARVQVVQFHNGEYFMDGVSMKKMSCTHESLSKGVSSQADKINGLLISLFAPFIEDVTKNSPTPYLLKNQKDSFGKHAFETANVHCYSVLPIRHKNAICGYLMAQWCNPHKAKYVISDSEKYMNEMTNTRNEIEVYLEEQSRSK